MTENLGEYVAHPLTKIHFNHREFVSVNKMFPHGDVIPNKKTLSEVADLLAELLKSRPDDPLILEDLNTLASFLDVAVPPKDSAEPKWILEAAREEIAKMKK